MTDWPTPPVRRLIERFSLGWTYEPDELLPDSNRRVQIRETAHYAPSDKVTELKAAYKRGDEIDPVIITADDYYVDGNTRAVAQKRNGTARAHVVRLNVRYEDVNGTEAERNLKALGAALNIRNGKGLDKVERANAVRKLLEDPQLANNLTAVASMLGVSDDQVRQIKSEVNGRDRLERLIGRPPNGSVADSAVRLFDTRVAKWTEAPLTRFAKLVVDARLSRKAAEVLIKRVEELPSEADQVALLDAERADLEARIKNLRMQDNGTGTRHARIPSWDVVRRAVEALLRQEPSHWVNPSARSESYVVAYSKLAEMANEAARLQREAMARVAQ